ncbi:Protein arginine N-methyltransferase 2 [Tupaia chinensis]|uniref:Protein arginine N-methyltransferase 2 n=1 Tax=Tupaia chinensis TaxID=246437 RepID=L9KQV5_TUPCH|nr:Protein arginine N-methyltransferase 2 [Tupaia chinensis]
MDEHVGCCGYVPANHVGRQVEEYGLEDTWQAEEYFGSNGTLKLHLEMLTDQPWTTKHHSVILQNTRIPEGQSHRGLRCGTGISSLFCAHYVQPKAVCAMEARAMVQHTGQLVLQNGFGNTITVFQHKVEEGVLLEEEVLVSE